MNNLENLRKQAKQLVRWHRDRVWTVAQVIRETLPRYASLTDREILDGEFKLCHAQELIAAREGFGDWTTLVAAHSPGEAGSAPAIRASAGPLESDGASASPDAAEVAPTRARLRIARPFVFVRDVDAACDFYARTFGFEIVFTYGQPAFYAEIERDAVRLCVRATDAPMIDPEQALREEVVSLSIEVDDAKALYLEFQTAGAEFSQPYRIEPYRARGFIVDDLCRNRLLFYDLGLQREEAGEEDRE